MAASFEEIVEALRNSGLDDAAIKAMATWADFMLNGDAIREELAAEKAGVLEELRNALVGDASPRAIEFAERMAERALEQLTKGLELGELAKLGKEIAGAVEKGWHPHEAARHLESIKGLDSRRAATYRNYLDYLDSIDPPLSREAWERRSQSMYDKLLRERKRDVAHTEIRNATSTANQERAGERGATAKFWSSEGGSRVCPICQKNEAEGIVPLDHKFKASGHEHPPAHPGGCRCTVGYLYSQDQIERFQPLMDERIRKTAESVEAGVDPEPRPPI